MQSIINKYNYEHSRSRLLDSRADRITVINTCSSKINLKVSYNALFNDNFFIYIKH